jgi:Icc protein
VKIGHISDFHLRHNLPGTSAVPTRLSRQLPELIARAVEQLCAEDLDWVAVTGDLVDHPFDDMHSPENMARGEADLELVRQLLEPLKCPVVALYGNHDHPLLFRRVFPMSHSGLELADYRIFSFYDEEGRGHVPERVGGGLERFDEALASADQRPQIHLQHYLVYPEKNEGYPHSYGQAARLKEALEDCGKVRLLLSGHYHAGVLPLVEGNVAYAVAPAFCEAPHVFRIYELEENSVQARSLQLLP